MIECLSLQFVICSGEIILQACHTVVTVTGELRIIICSGDLLMNKKTCNTGAAEDLTLQNSNRVITGLGFSFLSRLHIHHPDPPFFPNPSGQPSAEFYRDI